MAAFGSIISGAGQQLGQLGQQIREQRFQHQQNELNRWQTQHQALADAIERAAGRYQGAEGERLRDLQMEVNSLRPGTDLTPYHTKYSQHRQKAEQEVAQAAMQGARQAPGAASTPPSSIPTVGGIQPIQGGGFRAPAPFAAMMAPPQQPAAPLAAQPASSPVSPQAQGGGNSPSATFRQPVQSSTDVSGASGQGSGEPVSSISPVDDIQPIKTGTLDVPQLLDLQSILRPSVEALQNTGYIDPFIESAYPAELQRRMELESILPKTDLGIEAGKRRLSALDEAGVLSDLPDMLKRMIQAEAMMGGTGNNALALGPLLGAMAPQSIPGQETVGSLEARDPGFLAKQGFDVSKLDPNTPVRVQRSKLPPYGAISAELSSVPLQQKNFAEGAFQYNPRTGQMEKIEGLTPTSMVPSVSTQVSPGSAPVTTTRIKTVPGATSSKGTAPQKTSGITPGPGMQSAGSSLEAWAKDVRDGKRALPGDARTSNAVQAIMAQKGWEVPTPLSPTGQKAVASIDPILDEVKRVQQMMDQMGISKLGTLEGKKRLATSWIDYNYLHKNSPEAALISSLSFADLRSAAQALQGTGSRAYPILVRALEHTPVIGINSDDPALIMSKLHEMETRLMEARQAVFEDEKKSGVISPVQGAPSPKQVYSTGDPEADRYLNGR